MADIDLEMFASLFDRLGDRLDETEGDALVTSELIKIRQILVEMAKLARQGGNPQVTERRTAQAFANEFMNKWKSEDPLKDLKEKRASKNTDDRASGTFIERERKRLAGANTEASNSLGNFSKNLGKATGGVVNRFTQLDGSAKGLAAALGATGVAGKVVAGWLDKNTDAYRDIIASSEGSIGSFMDMRKAAADAGVDVSLFAEQMKKGSDGVRLLGGKDWLKFNKSVRDATLSTGLMGMSTKDMAEAQGVYLEMLNKQGKINDFSAEEQSKNFRQLISTTQNVAGILGKTRDEQLKAAKEAASNPDLATALAGQKRDQGEVNAITNLVAGLQGMSADAAKMFSEVAVGGGPQTEASQNFIAAGGERTQKLYQAAMDVFNGRKVGDDFAQKTLGEYQKGAIAAGQDSSMMQMTSILGNRGVAGFSGLNQMDLAARSLNTDKAVPDQSQQTDAASRAILKVEEAQNRVSAALQSMVNSVLEPMTTKFGPAVEDLIDSVIASTGKINSFANSMSNYPTLMTGIGIAAIGLLGGFKLLAFGLKPILWMFKTISGGAAGGGLVKGVKSLFGRGGGAAAGAAGTAGAASGGTFISRMLNGAGSAGAGAASGAGGAAKGLLKGSLGIGALIESIDYFTGEKAASLKNLAKSGISLGGGAIGGALGTAAGPLGTIGGGLAGYKGGQMLGDWLLGPDDKPANASNIGKKLNQPQQNQNQKPTPANASNGPTRGQTLTLDQMTNRIMDSTTQAAMHLKKIRESSEAEVALLREDIAMSRTFNERIIRLMEEGNKYSRAIQDQSA